MMPLNHQATNQTTPEIASKTCAHLINHVYKQTNLAMVASFFCAAIVFLGLIPTFKYNFSLYAWFSFYALITFLRISVVYAFEHRNLSTHINLWRNLYIVGSLFGGMSWGLLAILLLPYATPEQQMLIILMLAGVTAGALPLSSAVPAAAIAFLVTSILPFLITIALFGTYIHYLFDMALLVYLLYSMVLVLRAYRLVRDASILQFENDSLLQHLSEAKIQLENSNKKLEETATHDALTSIPNRSLFQRKLEEAILKARKSQQRGALLYIDLDRFKLVNDVYGHDVGDKLLIEIVGELKNYFTHNEVIARLGGDEFTVILENIKNSDAIEKIAEELCDIIAKPIQIKNLIIKISASIGIAVFPGDGTNAETLLTVADKAMYYVKEHGGSCSKLANDLPAFLS
ncbi:MAG: GGDEF domain-containing protein [Gammaproteobacteria bacterium]|nr:GGDEF domain-containing protein [Gammaproteobacteria bacterium]